MHHCIEFRSNLSVQLQRVMDLEQRTRSFLVANCTKLSWDSIFVSKNFGILCISGMVGSLRIHQATVFLGLCSPKTMQWYASMEDIWNITAEWLSKACYGVAIEPPLQPLTEESIESRSANRQDEAIADIHAKGSWGQWQSAIFDIRVFHSNTRSYSNIPSLYRRHEQQNKREFADRIREVEQASFTPFVFVTTGGMGRVFYWRLASLLSRCSSNAYSRALAWMRYTLSFLSIRSAVVCICGSRSISLRSGEASPEMGMGTIEFCFLAVVQHMPTGLVAREDHLAREKYI